MQHACLGSLTALFQLDMLMSRASSDRAVEHEGCLQQSKDDSVSRVEALLVALLLCWDLGSGELSRRDRSDRRHHVIPRADF